MYSFNTDDACKLSFGVPTFYGRNSLFIEFSVVPLAKHTGNGRNVDVPAVIMTAFVVNFTSTQATVFNPSGKLLQQQKPSASITLGEVVWLRPSKTLVLARLHLTHCLTSTIS